MIKNVIFWLNCARVYSLPITVLNWLVIFVFSLKSGGNALLGVVALFGIGLVHMATNLLDDYFDYKDDHNIFCILHLYHQHKMQEILLLMFFL